MTGDRVRQLTGGLGVAAVVLTLGGRLLVPADAPGSSATPEEVLRWTLDDRRSLLVAGVLVAAGLALGVGFFAGLRALCARAEGAPGILATIGYGSMLVVIGLIGVGVALAQTQAFLALDSDPAAVKAFHEARVLVVDLAGVPAAAGFLAFGSSMVRTAYPSRSLGWAAGVVAVAQLLGAVSLSRTGFWSPGGGASTLAVVTVGAWVAVTSIVLLLGRPRPAP